MQSKIIAYHGSGDHHQANHFAFVSSAERRGRAKIYRVGDIHDSRDDV